MLIGAGAITATLRELGVARDDTVLVHSGLQGSGRIAGARSRDKLDTIVRGLADAVPDGTLLMPTFTYSFCRGEVFDRRASPSTVGLLTEHFRHLPGVRRTAEPIFSCAVLGPIEPAWEEPLFAVRDQDCFGPESVFAYLLERSGRILFYDVGFGFGTFVHHVEQLLGVAYRYKKRFTGTVRDGALERSVAADYFVRRVDQDVETDLAPLAGSLLASGGARHTSIQGGPTLLLTETRAILEQVSLALAENPDYLLRRGHTGVGAVA